MGRISLLNLHVILVLLLKLKLVFSQTTSDCDVTVSCFRYPDGCVDTGCLVIYKWINNGDSTDFEIAGKINTFKDRYLAIGFSNDGSMFNDTVVACTTNGDAHHLYTTVYTTPSFQNESDVSVGLSDVRVSQNDNWFLCSFKRQKRNDALARYFDLNNNYYVLAAYGNFDTTTNTVQKHAFRAPSLVKYNFTQYNVNPVANVLSTCDPTKSCFKSPANCVDDGSCTFVYQWTDNGDSNDFTLAGKINTFTVPRYLAIGFAVNNSMADADIVGCVTTGEVFHYDVQDHTQPDFLNSTDRSVGLSRVNSTQYNNWFICSFRRQTVNSAVINYFDLTKSYNVLAAYGNFNTTTQRVRYHDFRVASDGKFNFSAPANPITKLLSTCDTTNNCFKSPTDCTDDNTCNFVFQWTDNGDSNDFTLSGRVKTFTLPRYVAIGFSKNSNMGDDDIVACITTGEAYHYYVPGYVSPSFINETDRSVGLSRVSSTNYNSWFLCSFRREKTRSVINYFDLTNSYNVLVGLGNFNASTGRVRKHEVKAASVGKYKFSTLATTQPQPLTTEIPSNPITNLLASCGTVNECFKFPVDCKSDTCKFIYQWTDNGDSNDFTLAAKVNSFTNRYLAIGFSKNSQMGNDGVVSCKSSGVAHHYWNPPSYVAPVFLNDTDRSVGLSNVNVTQFNGWLVCQVRREKQNSNNVTNYVDLNNRYYVLAALGDFDDATQLLKYHEFKIASTSDYSFNGSMVTSISPRTSALTTTPAANSIAELQSTCGIKYGCFISPSDCKGTACTFIYKWADNGDKTDFVVAGKINSFANRYLAIAYSTDNKMGDDSLVVCKTTGTTSTIETMYNPDYRPALIDPARPTLGLSSTKVKTDGNWVICEFTRVKQYPVSFNGRKRRDAASEYFDLNKQFYLLAAYGNFDPATGTLEKHDNKVPSPKALNFKSLEVVGGSVDLAKYKAHGTLMVIAWVLFASTGILFARYYKDLFPGEKFMGVQFWFTMHRPVMSMVPLISVIALIVILWQRGWTWIATVDKTAFLHSIFGIIAIAFAFIQPFLAMLRCDKDHPQRYVFNWVHRTIGLSALICAIVALFLGLNINLLGLNDYGWGILLGWTLWLVILVTILELIVLKYQNNQSIVAVDEKEPKKTPKSTKLKSIMLISHLVVTSGFTIALLVLIGFADPSQSSSS